MAWEKKTNIKGPKGTDGADGVMQSIVAGANITVDATDPANPVISSTASGSGDMEKAVYDPTGVEADAFKADNHVDGTTKVVMLATERTKLGGIATGATANSPDATLLARANHTGSQLAATISDFAAAADARISAAIGVTVQAFSAILAATTAAFTTAKDTKLSGIADGATANATDAALRDRATHTGAQAISTITGLQTALDGKETANTFLLKSNISANLNAGYANIAVDDGTKTAGGTYQPSPAGGNFRKLANGGNFTLQAPTLANSYELTVDITNVSGAGTITFTGFVTGNPKGASLTTTVGHKFKLFIHKSDVGATATIEAMQ